MKYFFPLLLWGLAALFTYWLYELGGMEWSVNIGIGAIRFTGQDMGDTIQWIFQKIAATASLTLLAQTGYIAGQSLLEEIIKFFAFLIMFLAIKPSSIRQMVSIGMMIGAGFGFIESTIFYLDSNLLHMFIAIIFRSLGHAVFTGIVSLVFGYGYFAQMRWIDSGAEGWISATLVRYGENALITLCAIGGIIVVSIIHTTINASIGLGASNIGSMIVMIAGIILWTMSQTRDARKPYGILLRRVDLMKTINRARHDLYDILPPQKPSILRQTPLPRPDFVHERLKKKFAKT